MTDYMTLVQLANRLDNAYGKDNYELLLSDVKRRGYKVLRNSQGKHRLKEQELSSIFGDMFGGMF